MTKHVADEVLAHSEDADEWEETAEPIEVRPSGSQVISARLPDDVAQRFLEEAARRGLKPSQLARAAIEMLLDVEPRVEAIKYYYGAKARLWGTGVASYETESPLVLKESWVTSLPLVSLGYDTPGELAP